MVVLVSELIFYHRCKIYFNYQDEQLRGSAYYPSGPNPARRPLCAPCQYFQLSMALTFPVAGVLISSANCGATDRFPGPLNTSLLTPSRIFPQTHFLHQDLKIARCHNTSTVPGPQRPSRSHKHKLPFLVLTGISLARGDFWLPTQEAETHTEWKREREKVTTELCFPSAQYQNNSHALSVISICLWLAQPLLEMINVFRHLRKKEDHWYVRYLIRARKRGEVMLCQI